MIKRIAKVNRIAIAILPIALVAVTTVATARSDIASKTMTVAGSAVPVQARRFDNANYNVPTATTPAVLAATVVEAEVLIEEDPQLAFELAQGAYEVAEEVVGWVAHLLE